MAASDGEKNSPIHSSAWLNIRPRLPRDMLNSGRPIFGHIYLREIELSISFLKSKIRGHCDH